MSIDFHTLNVVYPQITNISLDNLYISANSHSTNFPTTKNAFQKSINQKSNNPEHYDKVISKFDSSGILIWSTYFGGKLDDGGSLDGISVDEENNILIGIQTSVDDLPSDILYSGSEDGYVAKFSQ